MNRSLPGAQEERGVRVASVLLTGSSVSCEAGPTCPTPAEGSENQRGGQTQLCGAQARRTVKAWTTPASCPSASHFSQAPTGRREIKGRPESQAAANGLCQTQVRWHQAASRARTSPALLSLTPEPPPGPRGPAVTQLVGADLTACADNPRGLPGGGQGRGSPRRGKQGAPPWGCS